jgi:hypothetical protein
LVGLFNSSFDSAVEAAVSSENFVPSDKSIVVSGYAETIAPVKKSLRRHTPGVCDVYVYYPEMLRLYAVIKPHVPKRD